MATKLEPVIYRNETPAPTEPGWYWAAAARGWDPEPVMVFTARTGLLHFKVVGSKAEIEYPESYVWFGPVTMVREG